MPMWLIAVLIVAAAITGSLIGSFAVLAWALSILHNTRGNRRS